ncbi:TldD/PmbA family protein [Glaciimonas sp. Gout2]|uniref:TldD/PmbA family protein n=1 Tax=unclassified Glaciimonas TaxID=2644401 RepID=UPI002B229DAA|nr:MULTISPECIES: TldD/PmbA family protein [unclassified Glaciimonas]MEB0011968.1 TldD/PmbA family protein [Glaciimonas sp. Cout2]MEB0082796.1 TldD/PmbA family protein [Glaciimonas sp. Gout2]
MYDNIRALFKRLAPAVDFCSLRLVDETSEHIMVRQDILQPISHRSDRGAMLTVIHRGGYGYAATSDLSENGLKEALRRAKDWAEASAGRSVVDYSHILMPRPVGHYAGPGAGEQNRATLASTWSRKDVIALLLRESTACRIDSRIVDWYAAFGTITTDQLYISADGADVLQQFHYVMPNLAATANQGGDTQTRSLGGQYNGYCRQGDMEVLSAAGFDGSGQRIAEQALALLAAPNCPTGITDLLLMPEQMMLQIHESIGHPLELDRILGDERNFAGTSFVTLDMFGIFQYGSDLLNVTYDPSRVDQFASYQWDDDGSPAERSFVIQNGILKKPLGGSISQARAGIDGVANSRACSWNRPPIDRMANLNIEPGNSSLQDLIGSVERGVLMDTNVSWSIDDSRNKFQFGCETGRLIENGELKGVVKNPNYRGISESFWRSLKGVGDQSTFNVMGTPFCGKGEPSQVIRVGHASPACLFSNIAVFGGDAA